MLVYSAGQLLGDRGHGRP